MTNLRPEHKISVLWLQEALKDPQKFIGLKEKDITNEAYTLKDLSKAANNITTNNCIHKAIEGMVPLSQWLNNLIKLKPKKAQINLLTLLKELPINLQKFLSNISNSEKGFFAPTTITYNLTDNNSGADTQNCNPLVLYGENDSHPSKNLFNQLFNLKTTQDPAEEKATQWLSPSTQELFQDLGKPRIRTYGFGNGGIKRIFAIDQGPTKDHQQIDIGTIESKAENLDEQIDKVFQGSNIEDLMQLYSQASLGVHINDKNNPPPSKVNTKNRALPDGLDTNGNFIYHDNENNNNS